MRQLNAENLEVFRNLFTFTKWVNTVKSRTHTEEGHNKNRTLNQDRYKIVGDISNSAERVLVRSNQLYFTTTFQMLVNE